MDTDDVLTGRLLSRREVVSLLGAGGAALFLGRPTGSGAPSRGPGCVVRPALTEGPYFIDEALQRSDIRSDPSDGSVQEGVPLALTFTVSQLRGGACAPLAGAVVDLWHCNAHGVYSDVTDPSFNTVGKKYLRGYQVTDAGGKATFTTIYPGWYDGRAVHLHFKIRSAAGTKPGHEFTSQLFFDEDFTDQVYTRAPYAGKGQRTRRNSTDRIFQQGGAQLLLHVARAGNGYAAAFDIALQLG
jgi:protocatechuate 3,4-dioxygenase beta subunit